MNPISLETTRAALAHIPADCDYDYYYRILAGVKDEHGDEGEAIAENWARRSPEKFNLAQFKSNWKSLKRGGGITIGTVLHEAKQRGFVNGESARIDPAEIERQRGERTELDAKAESKRQREQAQTVKWRGA